MLLKACRSALFSNRHYYETGDAFLGVYTVREKTFPDLLSGMGLI
jgi:hypothetical protein